jgi:hypothetical protein
MDTPSIPQGSPEAGTSQSPEQSHLQSSELLPTQTPEKEVPMPLPESSAPVVDRDQQTVPTVARDPEPATPSPPVVPTVTGPAVAGDVDVIEKEWVDKAETIVKENAEDPHAEEEAVEELQADYLQKRYNKDVKTPKEA